MRVAAAALTALALGGSVVLAGQQAEVSGPAAQRAPAKVVAALEQSGLSYRQAKDGIWALRLNAADDRAVDVIVDGQRELVVVLAIVARKPALTAEELSDLLRVSYDANFSKVALDADGDLLALTELTASSLTGRSLRIAIQQVVAAAISAAGALRTPKSAGGALARESYDGVSPASGASVTLLRGAFEISYDPRKWTRQDTKDLNAIQFTHASGDAYVRIITERIQIDADHFRDVALANAKSTMPDVQLDSETWRTSNGLQTLVVRYSGRTSGVRFTFLNQMYSDRAGTVQLAAWTGANLFDEYRRDFVELFNGLRKVPQTSGSR
jgi:hypothetical protein